MYSKYSYRSFSDSAFKAQLNQLFKLLKQAKFAARQNFLCCSGCAASQFGVDHNENGKYADAKGYVFYHHQDTQRLNETREDEKFEVYLKFGWFDYETNPGEDYLQALGLTLVSLAAYCGLKVEWNGQSDQCVLVSEA